jgi:glucosylceramidase
VQPSGGGTANGTVLVQQPCTGSAAQLWQFQSNGSGAYKVANQAATSEVWDVTGGTGATANGHRDPDLEQRRLIQPDLGSESAF